MAYSISSTVTCNAGGCEETASHVVYGRRSDRYGDYCPKHAAERVKMLDEIEEKDLPK